MDFGYAATDSVKLKSQIASGALEYGVALVKLFFLGSPALACPRLPSPVRLGARSCSANIEHEQVTKYISSYTLSPGLKRMVMLGHLCLG